jgi:hypothetical protein
MTLKEKFVEAILIPFENQGFYIDLDKVEECKKIADDYAIEFNSWMKKVDTQENAEKWFGYTDKDMLNIFKKEKGL